MKVSLFLLLVLLPLVSVAAKDVHVNYSIKSLRSLYQKASEDSRAGERFSELMQAYAGNDPVVLAYKAASEAIEAKYGSKTLAKLKHLKASARLFEQAVQLSGSNPEIRFLRYTVEQNVPRYLKMSEHVEEDKSVILSNLKSFSDTGIAVSWVCTVCEVMLSIGHCTPEEQEMVQAYQDHLMAKK